MAIGMMGHPVFSAIFILPSLKGDQAVLYIGNHRSYFDILLTYSRCPGLTGYENESYHSCLLSAEELRHLP